MRQKLRQQAEKEGKVKYHGSPCKHCGETLRWTRNAHCVKCQDARSKAWLKEYRKTDDYKNYQHEYHKVYRKAPENQERLEMIRHKYAAKKKGITVEEHIAAIQRMKEDVELRNKALANGDKFYTRHKECVRCGSHVRYTKSRNCRDCAKNKYQPVNKQ